MSQQPKEKPPVPAPGPEQPSTPKSAMPHVEETVPSASAVSPRPLSQLRRSITRKKWLWVANLAMTIVEVGVTAGLGNHYAVNKFSPDGNGVGFGA